MTVATGIPAWTAHPDVWLLVAAARSSGTRSRSQRIGPRYAGPGRPAVTRFQVVCFVLGVVAIWLAADWPIHDVAEKQMYSVHMVQHLMFSMLAAPLLLLGTPAWLLRWILRPPSRVFRVGALAGAVPARADRLQRRARAHALAGAREPQPDVGAAALRRSTRCCSSAR